MSSFRLLSHAGGMLLLGTTCLLAGENKKPAKPVDQPAPAAKSVEQISEAAQKSVVVVTFLGRDGKPQGMGTGFVIAPDGLIATNLHVIGEARAIRVELADGKGYDVKSVHASDRRLDLALLRIDAKHLTPLELGDSDKLKPGQAVVAIGNPLGLTRSVVSGVVSARRQIEGRSMIQMAIPIEPGNSGGPLLDMRGRVQGILTIKSLEKPNIGFAVAINALKPLIEKPNPVPMARWQTIGTVDTREWQTVFGAHWRQRAGRIQVDGAGSGFGGRALCLSRRTLPAEPYEVGVSVRLDDEAGAAGLVFHADGGDKHYGFYPSGGQLRLTRFDGPDVFTWKILSQKPSRHYRPGDWNTLKVRLDKDQIRCYVNDHLVFSSDDDELTGGKVGLAKFRDTRADFKSFRVAKQIPPSAIPEAVAARIAKSVASLPAQGVPRPELVDALVTDGPAGVAVLRDRAKALEQQAAQLRKLALEVHVKRVLAELAKVFRHKEDDIDLLQAALLVALLDNEELDVAAYHQEVDRLGRELADALPRKADDQAKLAALKKFLFTDHGFHGSRGDYYSKSNSYLNEVIDNREGLPITLSLLYMELAQRIRLKVVGVSLPGHFVVKYVPTKGEGQLIDVFDGARPLTRAEAENKVRETGRRLRDGDLAPAAKQAIITRMLTNLMGIAQDEHDMEGMLRYVEAMLAVAPEAAEERWMRAVLRYETGRHQGALQDADWLLSHQPAGVDLDRVRKLHRLLIEEPKTEDR